MMIRQKTSARLFAIASAIVMATCLASAQEPLELDENCTVTVGNQTAIVRPDGTFFVRNIAVFQSRDTGIAPQLYRVRATCLRGGQAITGQSDFFSLSPGQTTFIVDVLPTELDPIPISIEATAPADFIPFGSTVQLTVTATLPNNSTEDVTPRSKGTTYLSTNPRLLTVTENGIVTGANNTDNPQTGTIAVLNEGNITTLNFRAVGSSNDFDNDGIPNDYEDLFGLNKFVNDADQDLDNDGLTNGDEFELGTIPNNPDTDGDTIIDGEDGDPLHPEEGPPTVNIVSPINGSQLVENSTIQFAVAANDDGKLTSVQLSTNTGVSQNFTQPSYVLEFVVPPAGGPDIVFTATATDSVNNSTTATATVSVIADPLTTVTGIVQFEGGARVSGATVTTNGGLSAITSANGTFSIPSVPTALGDIVVRATKDVNGAQFVGCSAVVPPVLGGTTNVGNITIIDRPELTLVFGTRAERTVAFAELVAQGFPAETQVTLPTDLSPYGTIYYIDATSAGLSPDERNRLVDFVRAGRGLYLTGERPCCDVLNDTIEAVVNSLVAGPDISIGRLGDINPPYLFNANVIAGISNTPNSLTTLPAAAAGGIAGLEDRNILVNGASLPVAAAWDSDDLENNGQGRLVVVMDVNWWTFATPSQRTEITNNLHTFLTFGMPTP